MTLQSEPSGHSFSVSDQAQPFVPVQVAAAEMPVHAFLSMQAPDGQVVPAGHGAPSEIHSQPAADEQAVASLAEQLPLEMKAGIFP